MSSPPPAPAAKLHHVEVTVRAFYSCEEADVCLAICSVVDIDSPQGAADWEKFMAQWITSLPRQIDGAPLTNLREMTYAEIMAYKAVEDGASFSSKAAEDRWQPIETAPKDGSWFLICRDEDGYESYEIGCYDPLDWPEFVPVADDLYRRTTKRISQWRGFNNFHRATHWRSLPITPEKAG